MSLEIASRRNRNNQQERLERHLEGLPDRIHSLSWLR
jgi:hypothetical protein